MELQKELLILSTQVIGLWFREEINRQIDGVATGSSLWLVLADVFIGMVQYKVKFEQQLYRSAGGGEPRHKHLLISDCEVDPQKSFKALFRQHN